MENDRDVFCKNIQVTGNTNLEGNTDLEQFKRRNCITKCMSDDDLRLRDHHQLNWIAASSYQILNDLNKNMFDNYFPYI